MLAIGAVEHKEQRIAAGLGEQLALLALKLRVEQDRGFDGVPVVHVVWRRLKIPSQFPRIRIQSHDGAGVEIVAFPALANEHGIGIARAPIEKIELRVVGSGHPSHAAAVEESVAVLGPGFGAWLTGIRLGVPAPLDRSGLWIERLEVTANVGYVSGNAGDDVIAGPQRSHGGKVAELGSGKVEGHATGAAARARPQN